MKTDYDAPRVRAEDELDTDSLEGLKAVESGKESNDDEEDFVAFEAPTTDLAGEELNIDVVPRQSDEFTCAICFLVQRNSRKSHTEPDGSEICLDCA